MVTFAVVTIFLLVLVAISIYVLVESRRLSLPVPLGLTVLTLLLPFATWTSVFGGQILRRLSSRRGGGSGGIGNLMRHPLAYSILQVLQGIASVVLTTLWSEGMVGSGQAVDCNMQSTWRRLWMAHDGRSIESIQNAFGCCGFNSVRDMAWPSPGGNVGLCRELTHRETSCAAPWQGSMQRLSGYQFGVALGCLIVQIASAVPTLLRIWREASENVARRGRNGNAAAAAAALEQGPEASLVRRAPGGGGDNSGSYRTMGHTYDDARGADPEALEEDDAEDEDFQHDTARLWRGNNNPER